MKLNTFKTTFFTLVFISLQCQASGGNLSYFPVLTDTPVNNNQSLAPGDEGQSSPVVYDVVLHEREEILSLLRQAEKLAMTPNPLNRPEKIELILHGPEVEYFRISQYQENREIVDLAAKLDAFNVVDVKMCSTMLRHRNIKDTDIPAFVDIVPYGPDEVQNLVGKGYIKL
jgi:intracellular sulfur oxidation DsrE/DsrF family protein